RGQGDLEADQVGEVALGGDGDQQEDQDELAGEELAGAALHHPLERAEAGDVVEAGQHDQRERGAGDRTVTSPGLRRRPRPPAAAPVRRAIGNSTWDWYSTPPSQATIPRTWIQSASRVTTRTWGPITCRRRGRGPWRRRRSGRRRRGSGPEDRRCPRRGGRWA